MPKHLGCAVITGGSKGIGFGLAHAFLEAGVCVFICGRNAAQLEQALLQLSESYPDIASDGCPCDVTESAALQNVWRQACARFGAVDFWINNAGACTAAVDVITMNETEIRSTLNTNILGAVLGSQIALQGMHQQGHGKIFNMEGWGSRGEWSAGMTVYGASKRAVSYFTKALAKENKNSPVQIGTLSPGMVATDLLISSWQHGNAQNWNKMKWLFMFIIDPPQPVCRSLVNGMRSTKKPHPRIVWMTPWRLLLRFFQPYYWRRNPIQHTELEKIK